MSLLKRLLVASPAGPLVLGLRDRLELWRTIGARPEAGGMLLNDQCAAFLAPRLARPGTAFLDVGAHIGSVLAAVRAHDPSVALFAIEAVPEKVEHLRRRFPGVVVHQIAAGDAERDVTFWVDDERPGYSSLAAGGGARRPITVSMRRLETLFPDEPIDVVKIDVEGAELGVLEGSEALIARARPTVMFESAPLPAGEPADAKRELWRWFDERDYDVLVPNRVAHDGPGLCAEGFEESHVWPRRTTNYFAIARERRIEVRDRARALLGVVAGA